ncbi:Ribosomal RNA small subunit methyltransferase [Venturia inaequalis]|nr:Ribosomal RNA small subunit methyltransferase [Venturia inaequalis]
MRFQTILAIPLFVAGALAAPLTESLLFERGVGQTGASDKICFMKKCLDIGKGGGPRCNTEQCFSSQAGNLVGCAQATLTKFSKFNTAYCVAGIIGLGFNMPAPCKDCLGKFTSIADQI